ncbi:Glia maturation factor beta [Bagarius yarrelli]|uniref:Glia maturation factor beta n=1 Tax=Bagarius yarrelli TaxID=175774 RepID=A0A556U704_BAGYA|nr:Glia maturation factor beta [Bagarius yarrelli]
MVRTAAHLSYAPPTDPAGSSAVKELQLLCKRSESLVVCEVDGDLVKKLRDFRFRKETSNAAIISCKPEQQMMYAGSKNKLVQTVELTKVFEIRNTEDLTEEWLREKLGFFR